MHVRFAESLGSRRRFHPEPLVQGQRFAAAQVGDAFLSSPLNSPMAPLPSRVTLRRQLRRLRRALSTSQRTQAAQRLARRLTGVSLFRSRQRIAFYLPNDGELDLRPLLARADRWGKRCFLPVIRPSQRLWFAAYRPGKPLQKNSLGIPEPIRSQRVGAKNLDLILMPLVAFDDQGNRLGMGGGYYDRTLAYLHQRRSWRRPRLVGIAYEFQRVDALDARPWDVPLDGVMTDQRWHPGQRRSR